MKIINRNQFILSALWKSIESFASKGISLFVSLILARLLLPSHYGLIILATVFISFCDMFLQNGLNVALIRKQNVNNCDYSTAMIFNLFFATLIYILLYFFAPKIAQFYSKPELQSVLRVTMLVLFFQACSIIIRAKAIRELKFKQMSIVAMLSGIISGLFGIFMAYHKFGVWALVTQLLSYNILDLLFISIILKWKINLQFSINSITEILKFSLYAIGSSVLDFVGNNVSSLIIGKTYLTDDLGYINRGSILPEQICLNIFNSINSVILPTLASRQSNIDDLKLITRKLVSITTFIIFPIMGILFATARSLIVILLTDKWINSVLILQWYCLYYACNPIRSINANIIYAIGKSKFMFYIEFLRCMTLIIISFFVLFIYHASIYTFIACNAILAIFVVIISQYVVMQLIGYKYIELFKDIFPALLLTTLMIFVILIINIINLSIVKQLLLQILIGIFVYLTLSKIFNISSYTELINILKIIYEHK